MNSYDELNMTTLQGNIWETVDSDIDDIIIDLYKMFEIKNSYDNASHKKLQRLKRQMAVVIADMMTKEKQAESRERIFYSMAKNRYYTETEVYNEWLSRENDGVKSLEDYIAAHYYERVI